MLASATTSIALIAVGSFTIIWITACKLISLLGWHDLAKRHTELSPAQGTRHSAQSLTIGRFGKYHGCVTIHTSQTGMYLTIFPIFRIGHPPIFLPWSAVRLLKQQQTFLGQRFLYDLGTPRVRRISLHGDIHQEIQHHQNGAERF